MMVLLRSKCDVPIGSDAFKLNYIQQVWDKTKNDWAKILENVSNKKWRLDMLKFGLHARFNHLFRCIEPRITSQMATALDTLFFGQVCIVAGEHWSKTYTGLAAQYFQPNVDDGTTAFQMQC